MEELEQGPAEAVALENARRKAHHIAAPDALVLGVDTVVALDGSLYGKPSGPEHARATLQALSGRVHTVISGVCVRAGGGERLTTVHTDVEFRALSPALLDWYLSSEEWRERAGGYAIQGRGAALVTRIDGDYSNVVGLPVSALLALAPELLEGR